MAQKLNVRIPPSRRRLEIDPVALTALLYLKEALVEERYEECAGIIRLALEFGAGEARVGYLLEDPRRPAVAAV
ncbi:MAG TPA: hypothetical protein VJC08_03265 [bacterium]|nr:hypothetical protein [bacterium]